MAPVGSRQVRISKIASRYLVFDIDDVAYLRRHHCICAVFVGTIPQNPTQNIFMGLPIELLPQEVAILLANQAAYLVDDHEAHLRQLSAPENETARKQYLQSFQAQRLLAQQALEEDKATRSAQGRARHERVRPPRSAAAAPAASQSELSMFGPPPAALPEVGSIPPKQQKQAAPNITPTTSKNLLGTDPPTQRFEAPHFDPLYAHLNAKGFFITPGLRFGGDYSVYPGDPFRFHAHFLANSYGWDEEISMLDLIGSGRLGTAVKKSFLLGGQQPRNDEGSKQNSEGDGVRVFCVEWAGM